jgi:hypothetical protein
MRRHVRSANGPTTSTSIDPLALEVATGTADLTADSNARLIVFGFDGDQKRGLLQNTLSTLRKLDPALAIYAVGDPTSAAGAFRPSPMRKPR